MSSGVARERPARRRLPAQERRGQLMDASIRLLARDGFPRTTADAIAAEAGVSKGLIWRHFDDLTDLLHQSGLHALRQITQAVAHELDFTAPVPDVIRAAIAVASRVPTRWPEQHRAIQQLTGSLRDSEGALVVSAAYVDEGATMKRFRPRAQGRASRINKRTSHITVVVSQPEIASRKGTR